MTKKGPLSKAEKFYIDNHSERSVDDLCKDLDRAKSTVNKYLDTVQKSKGTMLYDQFARNERGSTIMTENAATLSDEKRPVFNKGTSKTRSCTVSIRRSSNE
tara:strand:+ start:821 stop:1126 length:306 start_codon:yes stop_codon:yes gene_type:complete